MAGDGEGRGGTDAIADITSSDESKMKVKGAKKLRVYRHPQHILSTQSNYDKIS